MAELIFKQVGARIGQSILPGGIKLFSAQITGAQLGRTVGAAIGASFAPVRDGPRIEALRVMESREGAGMPSVYGRSRVPGQLIWAARFKERARDRRTAGKGSPRYREYRYSVSFAIALCEGEISRIGQVWANGEPMDLAGVNWRLYTGNEDQLPDPLIEAIEGAGAAPAYRGTAYAVFEDLPLEAYGNRIPQLGFEVFRTPPGAGDAETLRTLIKGVNIIPASGEFAYDTDIIRTRRFPGIETSQNANSSRGAADFSVSMDQLEADLPGVSRAALTIGWFGNDLRAGQCQIRPGVEIAAKSTVPDVWRAGGVERSGAYLISQDADGHASYGGTPSDASIIRALRDLASRGIQPTVTPFLFMDVPAGNGLPDPNGGAEQAPFPWRGRITGSAAEVADFLGAATLGDFQVSGERVDYSGDPNDWGYRRFVLHLAHLANLAGGVEAFLIGSEMVALSHVQAADGSFPFVDGLAALAADVKSLLGASVKVSYAADWTEYGAYVSGSDVYFPLDKLWADPSIDFVGIDWYPPMADWRGGDDHLDAGLYDGLEDANYLAANIDGGEGYDWYYADNAARSAQIRTPIIDTAHGEHWVFRQKDLPNWWSRAHHERPGGVRDAAPTAWTPSSKPIRLMEIGFPAVDKGANSPNLFFDPKSSESALPPFSDGTRNDIQQRRALETALGHWQSAAMIEAVYVWCWDARPYPAFPARSDVWSDGENWQFGHWLNGRVGASELGAAIEDICARGGVEVDASQLRGLIDGYALSGVYSVRGAIEPLRTAFGFDLIERSGELVFVSGEVLAPAAIDTGNVVQEGLSFNRRLLDKRPGELRLTYVSPDGDYAPATAQARDVRGDRGAVIDVSLPAVMSAARADSLAQNLLERALKGDTADLSVSLGDLGIEPGDTLQIGSDETLWRVDEIEDAGLTRSFGLSEFVAPLAGALASDLTENASRASVFAAPELLVIDALEDAPLIAAAGTPWPGSVSVRAGLDASLLTERAEITSAAGIGLVKTEITERAIGRWDRASVLEVYMPGAELSSETEAAVLSGANQLLIETGSGWELIAFCQAVLTGDETYRFSHLLRGLRGTTPGDIGVDARCVILDGAVELAGLSAEEIGAELQWQFVTDTIAGDLQGETFEARGALAFRLGHLRAEWQGSELEIRWTRRGKDTPESWALPEAENVGQFDIVFSDDEGDLGTWRSDTANLLVTPPAGAKWVKVAEIGPDGRRGAEAVLLIPAASA